MQLRKKVPGVQCPGAFDTVRATVKDHGPLGLYRGYSALLMFSVPKNYVRFGAFTYVQTNILTEKNQRNNFLAGLIAGAAEALLVVTPQETLKTKLIHDKVSAQHKYKNLFHGIYTIGSEHGLGGMYKGVVATVLKQSTN
jgi:solute carrier family 25 citrate transporter 1